MIKEGALVANKNDMPVYTPPWEWSLGLVSGDEKDGKIQVAWGPDDPPMEMDADEVYLVTVGVDMASEGTESWSAFLDNRETEQTIRYDFNTEAERDAFCDGYEIEPDEEIAVFFDEGEVVHPIVEDD